MERDLEAQFWLVRALSLFWYNCQSWKNGALAVFLIVTVHAHVAGD